jgi:hypothetical protein
LSSSSASVAGISSSASRVFQPVIGAGTEIGCASDCAANARRCARGRIGMGFLCLPQLMC